MSVLSGWSYRKSITLSRASGAVTNYQMKLLIGESSGATGEDVDCGGNCLPSFNDLRFTTSDGETLLDYWLESITGTTPNQLATVWIEFDSIGTGATTFYMYYGNAGASSVSNGANTFILFDDFERGNDGDAVGGSWTVISGSMLISTAHDAGDLTGVGTRSVKMVGNTSQALGRIYFTPPADMTYAVRARYYKPDATSSIQLTTLKNNHFLSVKIDGNEDISWLNSSGSFIDSTQNAVADSWDNVLEIRDIDTSGHSWKVYYNDALIASCGSMYEFVIADCIYVAGAAVNDQDGWIDNVLVRQYLSTEPAWGSWGAEQTLLITVAPDPLAVTAALSGTPWPELQKVTPGPMAVTAMLAAASVAAQFIVTPAALAVVAELSAGNILSFIDTNYLITYICYLTPQPSTGLSALTIPMSSFQGRFKSGDPSYLSIVTPGMSLASDITARVDETNPPELSVYMVKTYADGNQISELIMAVDLEDMRIDQGAVNQTLTLEGHRTNTYTSKSITLQGASYKNYYDGSTLYRCSPDLYLRPGDVVTVNGETFTANNISIAISVDSQTMEVSESD
jgi:hypothetical protein